MGRRTGCMRRFQDPVALISVGDDVIVPFDEQVSGRGFAEWGSGKGVDIEFGIGKRRGHYGVATGGKDGNGSK